MIDANAIQEVQNKIVHEGPDKQVKINEQKNVFTNDKALPKRSKSQRRSSIPDLVGVIEVILSLGSLFDVTTWF